MTNRKKISCKLICVATILDTFLVQLFTPERHPNNIKALNSYRTENKVRFRYKKTVKAVQENNSRLL